MIVASKLKLFQISATSSRRAFISPSSALLCHSRLTHSCGFDFQIRYVSNNTSPQTKRVSQTDIDTYFKSNESSFDKNSLLEKVKAAGVSSNRLDSCYK